MSGIPLEKWNTIPKSDNDVRIERPRARQFCMDHVPMYFDSSFPSSNEHLHGKPNPKTLERVPLVAPPTSWDYWSSSHSVPHAINKQVYFDNHNSGYRANPAPEKCQLSCKGGVKNEDNGNKNKPKNTIQSTLVFPTPKENGNGNRNEKKLPATLVYPTPKENGKQEVGNPTPNENGKQPYIPNVLVFPTPKEPNTSIPVVLTYPTPKESSVEGYSEEKGDKRDMVWINEKGTKGDILTNMYNPQQMLQHHIPSNVPVGDYSMRPELDEYNKRMYTHIIQPNMYNTVEVVEPIQSNIGMTHQQQLQPIRRERRGEDVLFTTMDPRVIRPMERPPHAPIEAMNHTVYDPRFTGYGTSYRMYVDDMTGQPRFMYDDIDAVRKPNYIIRSNIDHAPWASSYGSVEPEKEDGLNRQKVHSQFLGDTLQQREELQQRFMRKYNAQVAWQRRQAPIHTRNTA